MEHQNKLAFNDGWQYAPAPESTDHITIDKQYELFIDGEFVAPEKGRYFETINPATEEQATGTPTAQASMIGALAGSYSEGKTINCARR